MRFEVLALLVVMHILVLLFAATTCLIALKPREELSDTIRLFSRPLLILCYAYLFLEIYRVTIDPSLRKEWEEVFRASQAGTWAWYVSDRQAEEVQLAQLERRAGRWASISPNPKPGERVWYSVKGRSQSRLVELKELFGKANPQVEIQPLYPWIRQPEEAQLSELEKIFGKPKAKYRWLIRPKYTYGGKFSEGLWSVQKESEGPFGFVDSADNVIIDFQYKDTCGESRIGLTFVVVSRDLENKIDINGNKSSINGLIDKKGRYLIRPRRALGFRSFLDGEKNALVSFSDSDGKYGFLNLSDDIQIPAVYEATKGFSEGMAAVRLDDRWGIIDTEEKWVVSPRYRDLKFFWKGLIPFQSDAELWGLLDVRGEVVLEPKYKDISVSPDRSGPLRLLLGENPTKIGYLDENLRFLIDPERSEFNKDSFLFVEEYQAGLAFVYDSEKFIALDAKGEVMFEFPRQIAEPYAFWDYAEGYYVIKMKINGERVMRSNCFLVNKKGEMILPPEFEDINASEEGVIAVRRNRRWGLIVLDYDR
ncbi:MAG: WG repeat-containing protein [Synergistaceae bacterium]|jgi:hypothetical protein|nr:WG repeat-containing protein [Synergistaceae bacterium]